MGTTCDVISAGIIVADHVAAPVARMPGAGELVLTDECFLSIGGCASNVAVDLARLGVSVAVSGCVGDDPFGEFARSVLRSSGVDTEHLLTLPGTATSQTLIINVEGQDRRFVHHLGANRLFGGEHFPRARIRAAKILYVGGYFLLDGLAPDALAAQFRAARADGVATMLDVVTPGPRDYLAPLERILPHTDYFLPNFDEARLMTGRSDALEQAEAFRALGAGTVVITQGGAGSVLLSRDARIKAGVFPVPFVDGTGGGDAFDAGFIKGLLDGASAERCLELGSALGASCVRCSGATAGVFDAKELDQFLERNRLEFVRL